MEFDDPDDYNKDWRTESEKKAAAEKQVGEAGKIIKDSIKAIESEEKKIQEYLPKLLAREEYKKIPEIWLFTREGNTGYNFVYKLEYGKVFLSYEWSKNELSYEKFIDEFPDVYDLTMVAKRLLNSIWGDKK